MSGNLWAALLPAESAPFGVARLKFGSEGRQITDCFRRTVGGAIPYPLWPFGPSPLDKGSRPLPCEFHEILPGLGRGAPWGSRQGDASQEGTLIRPLRGGTFPLEGGRLGRAATWGRPYKGVRNLPLLRPFGGAFPPREGLGGRTMCAPTVGDKPVSLVRQRQAQSLNRTSGNFCKPRAQWPGGNSDQPLKFCAPETLLNFSGVRPP